MPPIIRSPHCPRTLQGAVRTPFSQPTAFGPAPTSGPRTSLPCALDPYPLDHPQTTCAPAFCVRTKRGRCGGVRKPDRNPPCADGSKGGEAPIMKSKPSGSEGRDPMADKGDFAEVTPPVAR